MFRRKTSCQVVGERGRSSVHAEKVSKKDPQGDHRCTPPEIWVSVLAAIGAKRFDLDPASNAFSTIPARTSWDGSCPAQDGLAVPWFGNVWLNFPFSKSDLWVDRALVEGASGRTSSITVLSPSDSSTAWWNRLRGECDLWTAWRGRIHFPLPGRPKGSPGGGIQLSYFGSDPARWYKVMEHLGHSTFGRSFA